MGEASDAVTVSVNPAQSSGHQLRGEETTLSESLSFRFESKSVVGSHETLPSISSIPPSPTLPSQNMSRFCSGIIKRANDVYHVLNVPSFLWGKAEPRLEEGKTRIRWTCVCFQFFCVKVYHKHSAYRLLEMWNPNV